MKGVHCCQLGLAVLVILLWGSCRWLWSSLGSPPFQPQLLHWDNDRPGGPPGLDPWEDEPEGAPEDLAWFVQISDTHISEFKDPGRISDLSDLVAFIRDGVQPAAVLVTGDLTDAKEDNHQGSRQFRAEWEAYRSVVRDSRITERVQWLDIKGNHDVFDVSSPSEDLYVRYSEQGPHHPASYLASIRVGNRSFGVLALDAAPRPGLKRPFNFFGTLTTPELRVLEGLVQETRESHDHTLIMGHYPTSTITVQGGIAIRDVLANGTYLCGHFHTVLNCNREMFTRHQTGLLELELGDWKDNRRFRILAWDRGFLSFADFTFESGSSAPIVTAVVTHPKNPYAWHASEPSQELKWAQFIRVLVFSSESIEQVLIQVGSGTFRPATRVGSSALWKLKWDPQPFWSGLHPIRIQVLLHSGAVYERDEVFALDGTQPQFSRLARLILMNDWLPFSQIVFSLSATGVILVLFLVRCLHQFWMLRDLGRWRPSQFFCLLRPGAWLLHNLWTLCSIDGLFWPLTLSILYIMIGPLTLAQVMSEQKGVIFVWGMFLLDGTYLPPDTVYVYAFLALLVHVAFMVSVSSALRRRRVVVHTKDGHANSVALFLWHNSGFTLILILVLVNVHSLWITYGFISIVSPIGLGRLLLYIWMYCLKVQSLKLAHFRELARVCSLDLA